MATKTSDGEAPRRASREEREGAELETRLEKAGFNSFQARALVEAGADCHLAVELLEAGCDPDTAVDILL